MAASFSVSLRHYCRPSPSDPLPPPPLHLSSASPLFQIATHSRRLRRRSCSRCRRTLLRHKSGPCLAGRPSPPFAFPPGLAPVPYPNRSSLPQGLWSSKVTLYLAARKQAPHNCSHSLTDGLGAIRQTCSSAIASKSLYLQEHTRTGIVTKSCDSLDRDLIWRAHCCGKRVVYWTLNDPAEMAACLAAGADGFFTDDVPLGRAALRAAGLIPAEALDQHGSSAP